MPFAWLQSGSIILPPLPAWRGGLAFAGFADVVAGLQRHSPACRVDPAADHSFLRVPGEMLAPAIAWSLRLQAAMGGFKPESRDCDDFADAFDLAVSWMAAVAGLEAAPAVGCIVVDQRREWATVRAGGRHSLNAVLTDAGVVIVEPQNGISCPVELYPNRTDIALASGF